METVDIAIVSAFVVTYAIVSSRLSTTVITGPIVFVSFGLIVGPEVLDVVDLSLDNEVVRTLAVLTLILVLYTDASRIDFRVLRQSSQIPLRLLVLGLPLTIALGAGFAALLFEGLDLWEVALLAAVLAPTDAALGQAVVTNPRVPVRIRQALNVESGLNDGLAVPFIVFFIAGAAATEELQSTSFWIEFALKQIGVGLLVGLGVGLAGAWLVERSTHRGWIGHSFQRLAIVGLAVLAFALAESIDGNGLIAVFVGGLSVGNVTRHHKGKLLDFSEQEGELLALLTFMIFGGAFLGAALDELTWRIALYAVLSLTIIRFVPVAISLIGMRLQRDTVAFLGWFGPRGLASIVFGLLVLETTDIAGRQEIFLVAVWTIFLSVIAHGLTAQPGARWYAARAEAMAEKPGMPEMEKVEELPVRARPLSQGTRAFSSRD